MFNVLYERQIKLRIIARLTIVLAVVFFLYPIHVFAKPCGIFWMVQPGQNNPEQIFES